MINDLRQVEVINKIVIPFKWKDPTPGGENLGCAEFSVCIKYKWGRVSEFWVYPLQQPNPTEYWHWAGGSEDRTIYFQSYNSMEAPRIWMAGYCEEHKTGFVRLYVPKYSKFLLITCHGLEFWDYNPYPEV